MPASRCLNLAYRSEWCWSVNTSTTLSYSVWHGLTKVCEISRLNTRAPLLDWRLLSSHSKFKRPFSNVYVLTISLAVLSQALLLVLVLPSSRSVKRVGVMAIGRSKVEATFYQLLFAVCCACNHCYSWIADCIHALHVSLLYRAFTTKLLRSSWFETICPPLLSKSVRAIHYKNFLNMMSINLLANIFSTVYANWWRYLICS